jgi:YbbR domain-containing protein
MNRYLKRLLVRDWELKLVSLVLALAIWLILVPADKVLSEKALTVPLEMRNIPLGLEIVEKDVSSVDVTVRAPNRILAEISPSDLIARLDLERATVYQQEYPLNKSMIIAPPGAEVTKVTPSKATIRLERTAEAALEVSPATWGKVATGFVVSRIDISPAKVFVRGPESKISDKDTVTTAPVNISGLSETTAFYVDIILPKPELRFASAQTSVRVTIHVVPADTDAATPAAKSRKK